MPQTIEGAFAQGAQDMIVVLPDSKTIHNGSMYSSSATTGDFERFISHDIVEYIDAHLCESIEMHGLARRFGWSESRLSRQFKQAFGMALFDYIGTARLTRARALLEVDRLSINQVALAVGYQHAANFSTAFKRQFCVSPHAVRKPGRLAS